MSLTRTHARYRRDDRERGFTLTELLVVVVIIGVLVGIAIPLYLNYTKGAADKAAASDVRNAITTVEQCYSDNGNAYPTAGAQASAGANLTFTGCSLSVNASDNVVLTYTYTAGPPATYTIVGKNNNGGKTYTYSSSTGKTVIS